MLSIFYVHREYALNSVSNHLFEFAAERNNNNNKAVARFYINGT